MTPASKARTPSTDPTPGGTPPPENRRIEIIDIARAVALLAMVVYHFTWDLEHFNYVERGLTGSGEWRIFARSIASSFLFLVGVSLVLAHGRGIRWRSFWVRLGQVAVGALAITVVTYFATHTSYVTFGILHQIVLASVLGLGFLFLPFWLNGLGAVLIIVLPYFVSSPAFDPGWLNWIGFFQTPPVSNDFVPVFPFFGAVLAGIAVAGLFRRLDLFDALGGLNPRLRRLSPLGVLGRHSLIFYLVHQPVLFGLVFLAAQIAPPDIGPVFDAECRRACLVDRSETFCLDYCACAKTDLTDAGLFTPLMEGRSTPDELQRVRDITNRCSFQVGQ